jgi:Xaa-Pro aminopeptidase
VHAATRIVQAGPYDTGVAERDRYPTYSDTEYTRRRAAVSAKLAEDDLDALLVYGAGRSADIEYLTGWPGSREAFLIVPPEGDMTLLVQLFNHVPNARRVAVIDDVRWAGPHSVAGVRAVIGDLGVAKRRIGLAGPWPWRDVDALRAELAPTEFVDATGILRGLRTIRSDEELARLRIAARMTDAAMRALERDVRPGMREHELAAIVEGAYLASGGTNAIHFMATTPMREPAIGVPSQIASSRVIEAGDVLITEIGAEWWGQAGQIHRAYAIGVEPTGEYSRLHDVAVDAYERIVAVLRDGATVGDVLDAAEIIHERGLTVYDDLLHGTAQLPPIIQTRRTKRTQWDEDFVFRENMAVVVQPNVTTDESGRMGVQVGETVRIARGGVERVHDYPMRFIVCGR